MRQIDAYTACLSTCVQRLYPLWNDRCHTEKQSFRNMTIAQQVRHKSFKAQNTLFVPPIKSGAAYKMQQYCLSSKMRGNSWSQKRVASPLPSYSLFQVLGLFSFTVLLLTLWRAPGSAPSVQRGLSRTPHAHAAATRRHSAAAAPANLTEFRVFVGVLSRPSNRTTRVAIRETWGSDSRLSRVMFLVLGPRSQQDQAALLDEALQFRDLLVVSDVLDSYHNTTHALVAFFRAAAAMGDSITHVLKTDEDCYVRAGPLLRSLQRLPRQWLFAGRLDNATVSRDPAYR